MCKGSKPKFGIMDGGLGLLELAAADDVSGFKSEVEINDLGLNDVGLWYGRRKNRKMGFEERTPLLIAALYGSTNILKYIISTQKADVNKRSASDGATALHCAAAGASSSAVETIKLLLDASADPNLTDGDGNKPVDLVPQNGIRSSKRKGMVMLLNGFFVNEEELEQSETEMIVKKKEYPVDVSLPDINDGVYGTDEFRMYVFKVKPCSRTYSHDWTECPFVHPGENARRRDPRKHQYSPVPCLEFRKGSCVKGENCEYAHGVFESWLHPAQYRTRLCKDETGCARKVCFFAHRVDELRPLYASTGSAVPSPKSGSVGPIEMSSMSPLDLSSSCSTPPMSPSMSPPGWQNKFVHLTPPALQLPGSRLKAALNARDLKMEIELLHRQQMVDDLSTNLYNNNIFGEMKPTNLEDVFGSPSRHQIRPEPNPNPFCLSYPSSFGFDSSTAVAQAVMNSRSGSFAKQRSQSFIDRGVGTPMNPRSMAGWGSPDGKVDWGFNSEDANKLRKSASFGFKSGSPGSPMKTSDVADDPWVYIEQEQVFV